MGIAAFPLHHRSRWSVILVALWVGLALLLTIAVYRGQSVRDELALPAIALFVVSAVLGSRLWAR